MTCDDVKDLISAELDGEAGTEEVAKVTTHLGVCLPCRRYREELAGIRARLKVWEDEPLPTRPMAPGRADVEEARRPLVRRLAMAASLAAVAVLGFGAGRATSPRASTIVREVAVPERRDAATSLVAEPRRGYVALVTVMPPARSSRAADAGDRAD